MRKSMTNLRWRHIIVHHSLTKDGSVVDWQAIRRYHMDTLGWKDIGYHFGVELINERPEILVGRTLDKMGAHTKGKNKTSIGICCVGDYDVSIPSDPMLAELAKLIRWLMKDYSIPRGQVLGHRDFSPKTCPGEYFDMSKLRGML